MICLKKQVLRDKANVVKNPIYDGRQCGIASLVNTFLINLDESGRKQNKTWILQQINEIMR